MPGKRLIWMLGWVSLTLAFPAMAGEDDEVIRNLDFLQRLDLLEDQDVLESLDQQAKQAQSAPPAPAVSPAPEDRQAARGKKEKS